MNRLAIITAFLGRVRNRYMTYHPDRTLEEKLGMAGRVRGCDGVEVCYPADFEDPANLKALLAKYELGVPAINFRSRRTGKWWRGSFTSAEAAERQEFVDELRRAMDLAVDLGCSRITMCPLNEGADVPFEVDYLKVYENAAESMLTACAHNRGVRICLEYKMNDPRARVLLGTAGEAASFCEMTGADNLGVTFDIGHSLLARERPAQAAVLLHKANRLFYVHLNDNDGVWDWDMIPGTYHLWEFLEFFYTLHRLGYDDDWYAFDVFAKEIDQIETFDTVMAMTRKLEALTRRIDPAKMESLQAQRNPTQIITYLYSLL